MIFLLGITLGCLTLAFSEFIYLLTRGYPEISRKTLHVLSHVVLVVLYLSGVTLVTALALSISWAALLFFMKFMPKEHALKLKSLHRVERTTLGGVFLVLSFAPMVMMELSMFMFVASYSVSAVADLNAAYLGRAYGRSPLFRFTPAKTRVGSAAFFVTAALCLSICWVFFLGELTSKDFGAILFLSLMLSIIENISSKGLDNITVPISCAIFLQLV